ncbi:MAG: InlB B-repeat-containing protein [Lachnospiraceae bacterium]|nr:InlB B-repeat-containing protein [Lachnospiraceae bacterium]
MLKKLRAVLTIASMAFVFLVMNAKALAYTGTGTEENPYVIKTYQELADLSRIIRQSGGEWWFQLGKNLQSEDNINGDLQILVGTVSNPVTMHLDLAGHCIIRIATTTDRGLFKICGGELIIDDSIGGGVVHSELYGGERSSVFTFPSHYEHDEQEVVALTINGGKFNGRNDSVFDAANINGRITINGGNFNYRTRIEKQPGEGTTDFYVNGGIFNELFLDMNGKCLIKECEITSKLSVSSDITLRNVIQSTSVVTVDDSVVTSLPSQSLEGHIVITDPNKPKITQQLESYTFPYLGAEHAFSITAENAEDGTWYVVDDDGNRYKSDYIMEQGWADVEFKNSGNTHKMVFSNVTADLDGMKVYCKIKGGGYTITSDSAEIHVAKKVKDISAEIANLNKAVAGRSANAYTNVRLRDFNGCAADYQSGSVQWHTSDGTLYEGKLVKDEVMTLWINVDLTDGYEFANDVTCTVKRVNGSDLEATRVAAQCTATHAVFEFTYVVPEAKDWNFSRYGVKINNGVGLTVNDPLERPALNAQYSATITDWRPGKYVLLRPSIPSSDQELDHWNVTVQFVVMPTTSLGNTNNPVYSYEDTFNETFFSEIDPTKLSAGDQAAVKAACKSENCMVACVVNLSPVFRDKPISYVISFDANGGEGTMGNKRVQPFEKYLLPACKFTWTGHDFIGWTVNDGTEVYQPGSSIDIAGNVTLRAQWKLSTCLIMVDLGSSSEQMGEVTGKGFNGTAGFYDYGTILTLTAVPFTGYEFREWRENGQGLYSLPSYTFAVDGDRTLTPVFQTKRVTIHFEGNYGQGTMADQKVEYDSLYALPECGFTNEYATFIGWTVAYGDSVDSTIYRAGKQFRFTDNVTVTAQWEYTELPLVKELIPDDTFRQYLKNRYDKDGDERINDLSKVKEVKCNNAGISSLEGIQYLYNLEYLSCESNNLTFLDVRRNENLSTLECGYNQLTKLNLQQNSKLWILSCKGNNIDDLRLPSSGKLSQLYCQDNPIRTLDVSGMNNLRRLVCQNCQLTELKLGTSPLVELNCAANPDLNLKSFNASIYPTLTDLWVGGCGVTELDISNCTLLTTLNCWGIPLNNLDLSNHTAMEYLYAGSCQLSEIDVSMLPNLKTLYLKNNAISQLDISMNPELNYLDCQENQLTVLDVSNCDKLKKGGGGELRVDEGVIVYETTPARYTITVQCDTTLGSVSIASNTWIQADKVTVTATPAAGCIFIAWKDNGEVVSKDATYVFAADKNRNLVAEFADEFIFIDENLTIAKKSLTLYDTITIDFKVPTAALEGYHDPYLVVTQNGATERITEYATSDDGSLLIFSYRVAPHNMRDTVTAVPHALNAYGIDATGVDMEYSVVDYCRNMLNKPDYQIDEYATFRRLLVDILLYGDAAQVFANYKTDQLASEFLSDAQRAMGTDVTAAMNYETVKEKLFATVSDEDALASVEAAALYLEAAVNIQFKYLANDLTGLRVVVTDDEAGTHVLGEYAADGSLIDAKGRYYVTFGGLNAGQMRKTVYATVMKGDVKVSNTYRYSIESYVESMRTNNGTPLDKLLDAMMRYGDSAAVFAR